MEILLVRHTAVEIPKSVCYGQTDVALADSFTVEKEDLWIKIETLNFITDAQKTGIYHSPLQRCHRLADFLAQKWNVQPVADSRLMEMNFGDWENKAWKDLPPDPFNAWMSDFVHTPTPNGESFAQLHARTSVFIDDIFKTNFEKIVVVTHAGNIRSIVSAALGLPLENAFRLALNYGAIAVLTLQKDSALNQLTCLL
jgi:alpha-ribazole phosphatase